jgi:hypothetical protein
MCKPKLYQKNILGKPKSAICKLLPPYANHKILVIPKSFAKSLRVLSARDTLFSWADYVPPFLVQSVEVSFFFGRKLVYMVYTGLPKFTSICPPMKYRSGKTSCLRASQLPYNVAVAERLRQAYPPLPEWAGVGSIPANSDAQNVPSFRRWRFEMKLSPFNFHP